MRDPRITEWLKPESVFGLLTAAFDLFITRYKYVHLFLAILRIDRRVLHNSLGKSRDELSTLYGCIKGIRDGCLEYRINTYGWGGITAAEL